MLEFWRVWYARKTGKYALINAVTFFGSWTCSPLTAEYNEIVDEIGLVWQADSRNVNSVKKSSSFGANCDQLSAMVYN